MKTSEYVQCLNFPCGDVDHAGYAIPSINIQAEDVSIVLISEAMPSNPDEGYYAVGKPLFAQTTLQAFNDAGAKVRSIDDLIKLGVYLTTAIKCAKTAYNIQSATVKECSHLLEKEIALFPNVKAYLLMGDIAIKAMNYIAIQQNKSRVIPVGSTYKIRKHECFFHGKRVFPSYLQAGPSFFIEKSKRRMIAEDIAAALVLI